MAYVHNVKKYDMENTGINGASASIWFNQCPHHCPGCWNPETWERNDKLYEDNDQIVAEVLEGLNAPMRLNTLTLLGGDPLSPLNVQDTIYILGKVKEARPDVTVVCWTGFVWNQVIHSKLLVPSLDYIDILIDGRFELEKRITGERFGSSNQNCVDVKKSLKENKLIVDERYYNDKKYI